MKKKKIEAGSYQIGDTFVVKRKPIPGRQQTTTWRNDLTGEWLGYTLSEAIVTLKRKEYEKTLVNGGQRENQN